MKRMRMMGLCLVAIFVIAAIAASGASAKTVLSLSTSAGELKAGSPVATFSSNLIFETVAGNLECEENELRGTVSGNNEAKIHGTVTEEESKGDYLGIPGACKTSATGPVDIVSSGFPWPIEFTTKGAGKVKGSKKVAFTSTFLAIEPPNKCEFEASTIKDTFKVSATKAPVVIETTKQKFKLNKKLPGTASVCPKEGLLSGTFTTSSGGKTLEAQLVTPPKK